MLDKEDVKKIKDALAEGIRPGLFVIEQSGRIDWHEVVDVVEVEEKTQVIAKSPKDGHYSIGWVERGKWNGMSLDDLPIKRVKCAKAAKCKSKGEKKCLRG